MSATTGTAGWIPPKELEGALQSLYRSYTRAYERWQAELAAYGEPPPVFIVVCPNTVVSKLVYDWIAGGPVADTGSMKAGELPLLSNVVDGVPLTRPVTVLIDSVRLESGDALAKDFREAAAGEIEAFKQHLRARTPGADVEEVSDEDLLREVMNTVGKKDRLGEDVRCVVSVAMLTEGWDANTVTHILGIRAFGSQLLCEQVVGRGLRRRSYALTDDGYFAPEYANIYGVPFQFIPTDRAITETQPPLPAVLVESVPGREHLRITFPKLEGYRVEVPDEEILDHLDTAPRFPIGPSTVPTRTEVAGIVGSDETVSQDAAAARPQAVAYTLARQLLRAHPAVLGEDTRPRRRPDEPFDRTLIVEVSGSQKSPGPTAAKAETARNQWCVAVNNHGGFGRWGYVEIRSMPSAHDVLIDAIAALYADAPIIGNPDLLDFDLRERVTAPSS